MKSELLKQIRSIFKPKQVQLNKRILYFLLFFSISFVIWFFNKLEKSYFSQIEIPVRFYNFPKNVIQTTPLPNKIKVSVYGRGFTILRYNIISFSKFYIDVNKYISNTLDENKTVFLYTENLISSLDKELSEEVKILNIEPKAIKFTFSKKSYKKLPVLPLVSYNINNNYILTDVSFFPQFVIISGPNNIIDTLDTLYTIPIILSNINKNHNFICQLKPIPLCEFETNNIELKLFVDKKTEKTIQIPTSNLIPEKIKAVRIIPENIELKFNVAVSKYNLIQLESFSFETIKSTPANNKQIIHYYPKVTKVPKYVSGIRFEPNYFTVITN